MKTNPIGICALLLAAVLLTGCPGLDDSGKDGCQTDGDCLNGYSCGPEGRCVEDRTCETDADCYNGYQCGPEGECEPDQGCQVDADCPSGRYCVAASGECAYDCASDADCPPDYTCGTRGRCVRDEPCAGDADCPAGHYCAPDGACQLQPTCQSDADCPEGSICAAGDCVSAPECQADADCPADRYCESGNCTFDCATDADCAADHLCAERGRCEPRPQCAQTDDCQLGEVCVGSICLPGCESSRDCPAGQICLADEGDHGLCAECGQDADCPAGQRCVAFECSAACANDADCQAGQICDGQSRCCTPQVEAVCTGGVAYWVDSCGNQTQREACEHGCDDAGQACDPGGTTVLCPSNCNWETEVLGEVCQSMYYFCFGGRFEAAQDEAGRLHVAWVDGGVYAALMGVDGEVRYARQTVSGFQAQQVDTIHQDSETLPVFMGTEVSLAVESDGRPHVGYTKPEGPQYVRLTGGSWDPVAGVFDADATKMGRLMMETGDVPHLTYSYYASLSNNGQRYLRWGGADWEQILSGHLDCEPQALDEGGLPHGACLDNQGDLAYGHLSGGVWETTHVWYGSNDDPHIAIDAQGLPHIIFRHDENPGTDYTNDLYYAAPDGLGGFEVEQIPLPTKVAGGPGLVIDPEGRPHVAFRDYSNKALWYGYKHAGQWNLQMVDDTVYYGSHHQIFLTPDGRPVIVRSTDDVLEVISLVP